MRRKNCIKTKHLLTLLLIFGIFVLYCSFNRYRENFFGGDDDDKEINKDEEVFDEEGKKVYECDDKEAKCADKDKLYECDAKKRNCSINKKKEEEDKELWGSFKLDDNGVTKRRMENEAKSQAEKQLLDEGTYTMMDIWTQSPLAMKRYQEIYKKKMIDYITEIKDKKD